MKLRKDKWERVKFEHIALCIEKHTKKPISEGFDKYIGLENINGETLKIEGFGNVANGTTFSKTFLEGDVLFGKRRSYLRKVAVAYFKGICSGDILVFRPRQEVLMPKMLPIYVSSPFFITHAINTSAGSLSPRTRWKDLAKLEFPLPPLEEQKQIAALFQSIDTAIEQVEGQEKKLKELALRIIDSLTSDEPSLGDIITKANLTNFKLGDIAYEYSKREENPRASNYKRYVGSDSIGRFDFKICRWQSNQDIISSMKVFVPNDYLLVRRSLYASDFRERAPRADFSGLCSGDIMTIKENNKVLSDGYLLIVLNAPRLWEYIVANASGSITRRVKWKELALFEISIPDIITQKTIVDIFAQLQNTLKQLNQQKNTLQNLKQKLLNEILG